MSRYACTPQENKLIPHFDEERLLEGASFDSCFQPTGKRGTVTVVFGFDHAVGLFCQIYATTEDCAQGQDELVVDVSSMFHGFSKSHLLQIIEDFVSDSNKAKYAKQLTLLALDLPF